MKHLMEYLSHIHGGRVLDMATRYGEFAFKLKAGLMDYEEIVAADCSEKTIEEARSKYPDCGIRFVVMDGEHLPEANGSFDTVCISNSLHHLVHPDRVLLEMLRVIASGGTFIINEMFSDHQTPAQRTHVLMHTLGGEIDTLLGEYHGPTGTKEKILSQAKSLGLHDMTSFEDWETDPIWDQKLEEKVHKIVKKAEKTKGMPGYENFVARAREIEALYEKNGIHRCTQLVIIGKK